MHKEKPAKVNEEASKVVAALQAGDQGPFLDIYKASKPKFLNWASRRFYANPGYFEDAWQEAAARFYQRATARSLKPMTCSIETFLIAIGRLWLLKNDRKLKRIWWRDAVDIAIITDPGILAFVLDDDLWEAEREMLLTAMMLLDPKCRELLKLRHFDGLTLEEITIELSFKNKNVTAASSSNCLKKLKEIIKKLSGK